MVDPLRLIRRARCALTAHDVKDKGWGILSCRRCGIRLKPSRRGVVGEVVRALRKPTTRDGFVTWEGSRQRVDPPEIFLADLHAWVRTNGSWVSFDISRQFLAFRPGRIGRARLRAAARAFEASYHG